MSHALQGLKVESSGLKTKFIGGVAKKYAFWYNQEKSFKFNDNSITADGFF